MSRFNELRTVHAIVGIPGDALEPISSMQQDAGQERLPQGVPRLEGRSVLLLDLHRGAALDDKGAFAAPAVA